MHFDNPIFILLVLAAGLLRWLSQRRDDTKSISDERRETATEEERTRRFLEALGQPATSKPPAKVTPRSPSEIKENSPVLETTRKVQEQRRSRPFQKTIIPNPLPRLTTAPKDFPAPKSIVPRVELIPQRAPAKIMSARSASAFEVRDLADEAALAGQPAAAPRVPDESLRTRLATFHALRDAIVLREILGPPRSLHALEHF